MSGICGLVNLAGRPVDRDLLGALTQSMTYRGPDGTGMRAEGEAGLGHALLCATETGALAQPSTLDGLVWITADARIDGQLELKRRLAAA
jgi:asparagine synthase (glutamine-hydrolysing)